MKSKNDISKAVKCLRSGGVIITPSESCYGLSCDAMNPDAVAKINLLKGRANMPMTILVSDLQMLEGLMKLNETVMSLSQAFHPGPLNIVVDFSKTEEFSYLSQNGLAFRIPNNKTLADLITAFGSPITTTSANRHGKPAIYKIDDIKTKFGDDVCAILDNGNLDESVPSSTVFDARDKSLIRSGPIDLDQILDVLNNR